MSDDLREVLRETMHEAAAPAAEVTSDAAEAPAPDAGLPDSSPGGDVSGEGEPLSVEVAPGDSVGVLDKPTLDRPKVDGRARDVAGKFTKGTKAGKTATAVPTPAVTSPTAAPKTEAQPNATPAPTPGEPSVALKPPQHWKPVAKEQWSALPDWAKQEVSRVDKEVQKVLMENAELRKGADGGLRSVVAPFENHIRRTGGDPAKAVHNMLQLGYALETGQPKQKAALLAHLMKQAGVSEDDFVEAYQGLGGEPGQASQSTQVDPRSIAQQVRQEILGEFQQMSQTQRTQKARTEFQAFVASEPEFLEPDSGGTPARGSVRSIMQVLISGGVAEGYQDAYDKACRLHPEVAPVLAQREAAKAATQQNGATQRARAAAISVKSEPSVDRPGAAPDSIRGALRESFAEVRGRRP